MANINIVHVVPKKYEGLDLAKRLDLLGLHGYSREIATAWHNAMEETGQNTYTVEIKPKLHMQVAGSISDDDKQSIADMQHRPDTVLFNSSFIASNNRVCLLLFVNILLGNHISVNDGDEVHYAYMATRPNQGRMFRHGTGKVVSVYDVFVEVLAKGSIESQFISPENITEVLSDKAQLSDEVVSDKARS